jgi:hypothetical protein
LLGGFRHDAADSAMKMTAASITISIVVKWCVSATGTVEWCRYGETRDTRIRIERSQYLLQYLLWSRLQI